MLIINCYLIGGEFCGLFISIFNSEFDLLLDITKTARKMKYSLNKEMNEKMENRNKSSVEFILIALVINVNGKSSLSLNAGFDLSLFLLEINKPFKMTL